MERLNLRLAEALLRTGRVSVIGPAGSSSYLSAEIKVTEVPVRPLPWFGFRAFLSAFRLVFKERPAWMVAGSGLTAPVTLLIARIVGAKAVVYVHGLDLLAANALYQSVWVRAIRLSDIIIANSRNTASLAAGAGVPEDRVHVLNPGVSIPDYVECSSGKVFNEFSSRKVMLSVGRLTERKGLRGFISDVLPLIVKQVPDVMLVVVGDDASDALGSARIGRREQLRGLVLAHGLQEHVAFVGACNDEVLQDLYRVSRVHVFPVVEIPGDVEGFGMVALEAAAYGVQTVAYAVGGVPDAVIDGETGALVSPGDTQGFARKVVEILQLESAEARKRCRDFAERMAWPVFAERLSVILDVS